MTDPTPEIKRVRAKRGKPDVGPTNDPDQNPRVRWLLDSNHPLAVAAAHSMVVQHIADIAKADPANADILTEAFGNFLRRYGAHQPYPAMMAAAECAVLDAMGNGGSQNPTSSQYIGQGVQEVDEVITGWRIYTLSGRADGDVVMKGKYQAEWPARTMIAECKIGGDTHSGLFRDLNRLRLASVGSDALQGDTRFTGLAPRATAVAHLRKGTCACGLYVASGKPDESYVKYDQPPGCLDGSVTYPAAAAAAVAVSGVVVQGSRGVKAERCTMEAIWIFTPGTCPKGHERILMKGSGDSYWVCRTGSNEKAEGRTVNVLQATLAARYQVPIRAMTSISFGARLEEGTLMTEENKG